jgi:hypothetical protein
VLTVFDQLSQAFAFASIPAQVPLAEIYRGVKIAETTPGKTG